MDGTFTAARVGVGAVVIRDGKVLLVKRGRPPGQGLWAIPGGSVELGETLQAAAEREILEETGVAIRAGEPVFAFDLIEKGEDGALKFHYVIVDLATEYVGGEPSAADDAEDARWLAPEDLKDFNVAPVTLELLKKLGFCRI
jgi:ADP-ribose pyrophosphatase